MKASVGIGLSAIALTVWVEASAAAPTSIPTPKVGIDACARTVLAQYPGDILQAVLKQERSGLVWELEIQQKDKLMDIECSADTGKIVETETRVRSASEEPFKSRAKVSEDDARKTVTDKFPGQIERVEYEVESDGKISYEFDVKTAQGDMRIEVDGESGKIVEESKELLEIGRLNGSGK